MTASRPQHADRGVAPVVGVAVLLSLTVALAAVVGGFAFGATDVGPRTPAAARTTGTYATGPSSGCGDNAVRVVHEGGETVAAADIAVVVKLPDSGSTARLVDLPVAGTALAESNTVDPDNVVYDYCVGGVVADGGQPWSGGRAIEFQLNAGGGTVDPGDRIEVLVVHEPSNGVVATAELTAR